MTAIRWATLALAMLLAACLAPPASAQNAERRWERANKAAEALLEDWRYYAATKKAEEAFALAAQAFEEDDPEYLASQQLLGSLYATMLQLDEAESLLQNVVSKRSALQGSTHPETVDAMHALAIALANASRYQRAEDLLQTVIRERRKALGDKHTLTLSARADLGELLVSMARFEEAEPLILSVYETRKAEFGPEAPDTLNSIIQLARFYHARQRFKSQFEGYHLVEDFAQLLDADNKMMTATTKMMEVNGMEHPDTLNAVILQDSILTAAEQSPWDDFAEAQLLIVQEHFANMYGPDHLQSLAVKSLLANLDRKKGNLEAAHRKWSEIKLAWGRSGRPNDVITAEFWSMYANLLMTQPENEDIVIFYLKQTVNQAHAYQSAAGVLPPAAKRRYLEQYIARIRTLQNMLVSAGRFAEAAQIADIVSSTNVSDLSSRSGDAYRLSLLSLTPREQEWAASKNAWAEEVNQSYSKVASYRDRLLRGEKLARKEEEQYEAASSNYSAALDAYTRNEMNWIETAKTVPEDQQTIEEYEQQLEAELRQRLAPYGPGVAYLKIMTFEADTFFFLVTEDNFQTFRSGLGAERTYQAIAWARKAVETKGGGRSGPVEAPDDTLPDGTSQLGWLDYLGVALMPYYVEDALEWADTETIIIDAEGPLRYAPFSAINLTFKGFLIENYNIVMYTPREDAAPHRSATGKAAAGFGVTRSHAEFAALPGVAAELERIFPGNDNSGTLAGSYYLDDAFDLARFEEEVSKAPSILHIASHFMLRPGDDNQSFLLLGDGSRLTLADIAASDRISFDGVDLLTLSACSTAMSSSNGAGSEMEDFATLAQRKGAGAVLATMWNVADDGTAQFMAEFYSRLEAGDVSKARALREAQLSLLNSGAYSDPYYWAPYVLMGDWE